MTRRWKRGAKQTGMKNGKQVRVETFKVKIAEYPQEGMFRPLYAVHVPAGQLSLSRQWLQPTYPGCVTIDGQSLPHLFLWRPVGQVWGVGGDPGDVEDAIFGVMPM